MFKSLGIVVLTTVLGASWAQSVELMNNQPGEVLLFPFFTAENGWDTYINLSLAGPSFQGGVAAKIRILDGVTGEVVKDFNIYPGRLENWRASISKDGELRTILRVEEGSCQVQEDLSFGEAGTIIEIPSGVGMIEVYGIGHYGHRNTTCQDIAERWQPGGAWDTDPSLDIIPRPNDRSIMGEAYLVNVNEGLAVTYSATALADVFTDFEHTAPGSSSPNLSEAEPIAIIDGITHQVVSDEGIDAVAMVLSMNKEFLINDVVSAPSINARTEWVMSYPLARHRNYKPHDVLVDENIRHCEAFGRKSPGQGEPTVMAILDSTTGVLAWGNGQSNGIEFSPAPMFPFAAAFCNAVNVVGFLEDHDPILVENESPYISPPPGDMVGNESYTLRWGPYPHEFPVGSGIKRPALGFRITTFQNGTLDGGNTLANYATLRAHQRR